MQRGVIALFGGAFDPIHLGHIKPAVQLSQCDEIKQVIFIPSQLHLYKGRVDSGRVDAKHSNNHRLAMIKLITHQPKMAIDTREIEADKTSYTVDTLRDFRAELGKDAPLAFIMGEDVFSNVSSWHNYRQLLNLSHLIVIRRSGCAEIDMNHPLLEMSGGFVSLSELVQKSVGKICQFNNEPIAVSSTEVRRLLGCGRQPRYLIPGAIWNYIQRNRLYSCDNV